MMFLGKVPPESKTMNEPGIRLEIAVSLRGDTR
jgi:hypothetical protein